MAKKKSKKEKTGCFTWIVSMLFMVFVLGEISKEMPQGSMPQLLLGSFVLYGLWCIFKKFDKPIKTPEQMRRDLGYSNNNDGDDDDNDDYFEYLKRNTRANHKINDGQLNLFIEYKDADGIKTERDIIVYGRTPFQPRGELRAFCELRHDFRTFKLNRIQTMVNKATGELIQNKQKFIDDFYS